MMSRASYEFIARLQRLNWPLVGLIGAMGVLGLAMMLSAGGGDIRIYALSQTIRFVMAFGLMLAIAALPMRLLLHYAYVIYFVALIALVVVELIGHIGMGAQRWIKVGGMNFQPSEMMKLAVILALARYYHMLRLEDVRRFVTLIPPVLLLLVPAVFILKQPNLGTTVITLGVGALVMFMAGVQWRYFIVVASSIACSAPVAWHFLHDYQKRRILTFLDPQADPLGAGYNILQSMIAVGSGGFFGKGYMQGTQSQLDFLPEKHTDFIFTVLAEEWGFVGGLILLSLYVVLMWVGMSVASSSRSSFGALVAVGVTGFIFFHVFINCAMVMGMIPVVGLPLPFLSYGGSIMLSTMLGMGLLLNADLNRNSQANSSRDFS